jgi:hypothetical protein
MNPLTIKAYEQYQQQQGLKAGAVNPNKIRRQSTTMALFDDLKLHQVQYQEDLTKKIQPENPVSTDGLTINDQRSHSPPTETFSAVQKMNVDREHQEPELPQKATTSIQTKQISRNSVELTQNRYSPAVKTFGAAKGLNVEPPPPPNSQKDVNIQPQQEQRSDTMDNTPQITTRLHS